MVPLLRNLEKIFPNLWKRLEGDEIYLATEPQNEAETLLAGRAGRISG